MSAPQNSIEWKQERRGYITSSQVHRLMSDPKSKAAKEAGELSEGAKTYVMELIAEEMGLYKPDIENDAMRWGHQCEPLARYHLSNNGGIVVPPFMKSLINGYGGSPDGLDLEYVYEIKCPYNSAVHLEYCLIKEPADIPKDYYWQCVSNHFITGRDVLYCSFDPRINSDLGLFKFIFTPDKNDVHRMLKKITSALAYKEEIKSQLKLLSNATRIIS